MEGTQGRDNGAETNSPLEVMIQQKENMLPSEDGTLRILYNNCNGLQPGELLKAKLKQRIEKKKDGYLSESVQYTKVKGMCGTMKKLNTNIMCLSETQTAWENTGVRDAIAKEFRRNDRYTSLTGSSSKAQAFSVVKPGGTAIIADGNWSGRIIKRGEDPYGLGRWSYIVIEGKKRTKLMVICGYRCCKGQRIQSVGALTAYSQQYHLLKKRGKKYPNPQKQFITDLKKFISESIIDANEILLCVDANEEWNEDSAIKAMSDSLGLIDIVSQEISPPPPTYERKGVSRRIDFILGTKSVAESIKSIMTSPTEIGQSIGDHNAIIIDINIQLLFHLQDHDSMSPTSRKLKSEDVKGVTKY